MIEGCSVEVCGTGGGEKPDLSGGKWSESSLERDAEYSGGKFGGSMLKYGFVNRPDMAGLDGLPSKGCSVASALGSTSSTTTDLGSPSSS